MEGDTNYWKNRRLNRRQVLRGGLALGAGAVGLSIGCAGGTTTNPTPAATSASVAPTVGPTATPGKPKPTGKFTIANTPPGIEAFDPLDYINTPQDVSYLPMFFENLVTRDLSGKLVPQLATKWAFREKGQKWDFEIRKGVKFHNGDPLTAADVKFSYDRFLKEPGRWKSGFALPPYLESVDIVDDFNVTFNLKTPYALFPSIVGLAITPKNYHEKVGYEGFRNNPVGTGPFRLAKWSKGESMEFEATEAHWRATPSVKTIMLRHAPDPATRIAMLRAKEVDLAFDLPSQAIKEIESDSDLRVDVSKEAGKNWFWFLENSRKDGDKFVGNKASPFADKRVRQAANYAINRQQMAERLYQGRATPATTVSMPGYFGFDAALKAYPYDPAKAKALLKEAGFADGFSTDIYAASIGMNGDIIQAVAQNLTAVGIKANPTLMEGGVLLDKEKNRQLTGLGFVSTGRQWDALLTMGYYSKTGPWSMTSDPDFDKLWAEASVEPDDVKREALVKKLNQMEYGDAHNLFVLYYHLIHGVNQKRVAEWPTQGYYGFLNFADQIKLKG